MIAQRIPRRTFSAYLLLSDQTKLCMLFELGHQVTFKTLKDCSMVPQDLGMVLQGPGVLLEDLGMLVDDLVLCSIGFLRSSDTDFVVVALL